MKYVDQRDLNEIKDLRQLAYRAAERFGDKDLYASPNPKNDFHYTYNDFKENIIRLGTAFMDLGWKDQKIAVIGEAHPAYMTTYYAAAITGNVIVPLDKELQTEEVANFLNRAKAVAVVYMPSMNDTIIHFSDRLETLQYFIPVAPEKQENDKILPYSALIEKGKKLYADGNHAFDTLPIDMEKMCTLLFTSGTTGTSKGVMLSMKNLAAAANDACKTVIFNDTNRFLSVLPMNHVYEATCGHIALPNIGATAYLNDQLKYVLKNLKAVKPDSLVLVPLFLETMHKAMWKEIHKRGMTKKVKLGIKLTSFLMKFGIDIRRKVFAEIIDSFGGRLENIICGGAPLDQEIVKSFYRFGINIYEGYGITECAPLISVNRPLNIVYGSAGKPVPGCEAKIDQPDENGVGEILARGDNVMLGYYENEEATREVFTEDGWFKTGDLGYMDRENNIFITGRKKNLIILSNGKNVFPEEIEEHLLHSELIAEAVVIERVAQTGEQLITALIYPQMELFENLSKEEIFDKIKAEVDKINKGLPTFKQVHQIEIRETEFEKTTTRKIKRYILK